MVGLLHVATRRADEVDSVGISCQVRPMRDRPSRRSSPRASPRRTATRETILAAALTCFAHDGYRRTALDRVAREAGISRAALYLHFGSKEALFRALVAAWHARPTARAHADGGGARRRGLAGGRRSLRGADGGAPLGHGGRHQGARARDAFAAGIPPTPRASGAHPARRVGAARHRRRRATGEGAMRDSARGSRSG